MWSLEFGGIERLVLDHCRVQRQLGIEPCVLVAQNQGRLAPLFENEGIPVHTAALRSGFDLRRERIARSMELMNEQDVAHFHCFTPAFARGAAKSGAGVVYTEHGNFGFGRRTTWRDRLKQIWKSRFISQSVDFLTFNSHFTRACAAQRMEFPQQVRVVHNGIDLERAGVRSGEVLETLPNDLRERFTVGTSSRFAGFKRVDRLIRAFAKMEGTNNSYLMLVGDGPLRSEYEQLVVSCRFPIEPCLQAFKRTSPTTRRSWTYACFRRKANRSA